MSRRFWIDLWWLLVYVFVGAVVCVGLSLGIMCSMEYYAALRLTQWTQNLVMLLLPAVLWVRIYKKERVREALHLAWPGWRVMVLVAALMVVGVPALDTLTTFCASLPLPEGIAQWAKETAKSQEGVIRVLIGGDTWMDWAQTIALMSVMTAVCEEWLFRGALVRCFVGQRTTDNGQQTTDKGQQTRDNGQRRFWAAFWVGLIFSVIHLDVYGLLPRWLLGSLFCYLVFWTRSVWPGVLAHALNNLWALIEAKTAPEGGAVEELMNVYSWEWYYVVPSAVAVVALLWLVNREGGKHTVATVGVGADEGIEPDRKG